MYCIWWLRQKERIFKLKWSRVGKLLLLLLRRRVKLMETSWWLLVAGRAADGERAEIWQDRWRGAMNRGRRMLSRAVQQELAIERY